METWRDVAMPLPQLREGSEETVKLIGKDSSEHLRELYWQSIARTVTTRPLKLQAESPTTLETGESC